MRFWRHKGGSEVDQAPSRETEREEPRVVQLDAGQLRELSAVFSAPRWLRNLGVLSWLPVGVGALLAALMLLVGATGQITGPVLIGFVVACVRRSKRQRERQGGRARDPLEVHRRHRDRHRPSHVPRARHSFAALSIFFLLKDGPSMRSWVDNHLGVPRPVARTITENMVVSLRRYFGGVTIVLADLAGAKEAAAREAEEVAASAWARPEPAPG